MRRCALLILAMYLFVHPYHAMAGPEGGSLIDNPSTITEIDPKAFYKDGSTPMEGDAPLGGNSVTDVLSVVFSSGGSVTGTPIYAESDTLQTVMERGPVMTQDLFYGIIDFDIRGSAQTYTFEVFGGTGTNGGAHFILGPESGPGSGYAQLYAGTNSGGRITLHAGTTPTEYMQILNQTPGLIYLFNHTLTNVVLAPDVVGACDDYGTNTTHVGTIVVCTNLTSAGIVACQDRLPNGGTIQLLGREYVMAAGGFDITNANITIQGVGWTTVLSHTNNVQSDDTIDVIASGFTLRDLRMIATRKGTSHSQVRAFLADINNGLIENVRLEESDDRAISQVDSDATNWVVRNCYVEHPDNRGIVLGGKYAIVEDCFVCDNDNQAIVLGDYGKAIHNRVVNSASIAIEADNVQCTVVDNTIISPGGDGIEIGEKGVAANNIIDTADDYGIQVVSNFATVVGNTIKDSGNGDADIYVLNREGVVIVGNACVSQAGRSEQGIYLDGSSNCVVSANTCADHDTTGIQEDSDCQDNLIAGNNVEQEATPRTLNGTSPTPFYISGVVNEQRHYAQLYMDGSQEQNLTASYLTLTNMTPTNVVNMTTTDSNIVVSVEGMYFCSFHVSGVLGAGEEIEGAVHVDGVEADNIEGQSGTQASGRQSTGGMGLLDLAGTESITLRFKSLDAAADFDPDKAQLTLYRIGAGF